MNYYLCVKSENISCTRGQNIRKCNKISAVHRGKISAMRVGIKLRKRESKLASHRQLFTMFKVLVMLTMRTMVVINLKMVAIMKILNRIF